MPVEDRRDHAICYRNRRKVMLWQADYIGVMTLECGDRYWVYVYEKKTRKGDLCVGVKMKLKVGEES
jgi:hypothetical protein